MASSGGGGFSYRPNVNRNVTKKWREASRPTYDDDDEWGDDGYGTYDPPPIPAPSSRPGWGGQMPPPSRSFTNPSPPRSTGRPSFDRGDDRRYVSAGSGFESAYPSTQRPPFPEPRHEEPPQPRFYAQPGPLHVNTPGQGPYPPPNFRPSSRGSQRSGHADGPFSAPGAYGQQRSHSGNRPGPGGFSHRQGSPARPDSRSSNNSNRVMPPRKSSLGQDHPQFPNFQAAIPADESEKASSPTNTPAKPLPFIRPSDIYKRMEEEKERERQSMDSSRPSLELDTARSRDSATTSRPGASDTKDTVVSEEESDSIKRLRTTLDPVPERKSEYGFDNLLKTAPALLAAKGSDGVQRHDTTASSVYTDRPDPVSASTDRSDDAEPSSAFSFQSNHPDLDETSSLATQRTTTASQNELTGKPTMTSTGQGTAYTGDTLGHKPSLGYRSVVQQAFDDSQKRETNSPTSTADTIPRSGSASTSELSPIISRKPDLPASFSADTVREPAIPEEPTTTPSIRPLSDATITGPVDNSQEPAVPTVSVIQAGYRRDNTPPNSGSPARQADVRRSNEIQPHQGVFARSSTTDSVAETEDFNRGRHSVGQGVISPSASQASGVSEEFNQWQAQSNQFNDRLGLKDSNLSPNSPVTRAESPPKGTVKGLAGKYESNSGRSTPTSAVQGEIESTRPAQARLESFRPIIPGGWQSFSTTPASTTPQQELSSFPSRLGEQRYDSTDSIPTAKAPKEQQSGYTQQAFAAAAAAGSALAGSFSGPAMSGQEADTSEDESDNEWEQSSTSSKAQPQTHDVRDFAMASGDTALKARGGKTPPDEPSFDTTPSDSLATDTPNEAGAGQSTLDYFPAPLRTSRSIEPGNNIRPPVTGRPSIEESAQHGDNDELQQEIVKSLTPRSSNFEAQSKDNAMKQMLPSTTFGINAPQPGLSAQESDDMYGGRSAQHTPPLQPSSRGMDSFDHQPQIAVSSVGSAPTRPFLEQRFSWEMEKESPGAPATTATVLAEDRPSTPPTIAPTTAESPETPRGPSTFVEPDQNAVPVSTSRPTSSRDAGDRLSEGADFENEPENPQRHLPVAAAVGASQLQSFQNIMKIGNQQDRIKAFEDNRVAYGRSDGVLDQWIQSMQMPDHADIFHSNGRIWKDSASGNTASQPQRVPSSRPIGNMSGARVMQEDGKKLMAAAGRFSGKAGVAAKGLFAKGKDKLRAASASEKGPQDKRKSPDPLPSIADEDSNSANDAAYLAAPPQLPTNDMAVSPMDETKWFGFEPDSVGTTKDDNRVKDHVLNGQHATVGAQTAPDATRTPSGGAAPITVSASSAMEGSRLSDFDRADTGVLNTNTSRTNPQDALDSNRPHPTLSTPVTETTTPNKHRRKVSDLTADEMGLSGADARLQTSQMLDVTDGRRHSNVSAVSSPSPSPARSNNDPVDRSISPALQRDERLDPVPGYDEVPQPPVTKDDEASQARATATEQHDPVPQYEEVAAAQGRQPHIGPNAQILPVADLGARQRPEPVISSRPFSFEGSEALRQAQRAYVQNQQSEDTASQLLSPISQTASKTLSQVSVEEVSDEPVQKQNRQSKSYSRPFGTESLGQHPAFRENDQQAISGPRDSSQNAGVDARRRQEGATEHHQLLRPTEEQGYRIPGPYHQEYRSPKPKPTQTPSPTAPQNQRTQNLPSVHHQVTNHNSPYEDYGEKGFPSNPRTTNTMGPPPLHDQPRPASPSKRSFGAFFRTKAKPVTTGRESSDRDEDVENDRRPSFFSRHSRKDSVASQHSSQNESRDIVGQLPSAAGRSKHRFSRDLSGRNTPTQPEAGDSSSKKKKRFSAMGNLFSKSDSKERAATPQRSTTLPSNSIPPERGQHQPQYQHTRNQPYPYSAPGESYAAQGPSPYHHENHVQSPQHLSYSQHYPTAAAGFPQPHYESRRFDLRIDTSGQGGRQINHPATAPPQNYASRDISYEGRPSSNNVEKTYQSRPAVATPSPSSTHFSPPTTRAPITAAGSATRPSNIDAHVVQLHKRSRSPTSEARRRSQLAPPVPEEDVVDPVGGLGTFSNKKYSPVDGVERSEGEQEKPWRIGIPGADSGEETRRTKQAIIEHGGKPRDMMARESAEDGGQGQQQQQQRTVAERMMAPTSVRPTSASSSTVPTAAPNGHAAYGPATTNNMSASAAAAKVTLPPPIPPMSPSRDASGNRDGRKAGYVAELPGSKADGYESEEEITMSATVRPGDWDWNMPVFVDDTK